MRPLIIPCLSLITAGASIPSLSLLHLRKGFDKLDVPFIAASSDINPYGTGG